MIQVFAAGSLQAAFNDIAKLAERELGLTVLTRYGASGRLREAIEDGEDADIFASANMGHPATLTPHRAAGPVICFARNQLCVLAPRRLRLTPENLLARLLDPAISIGMSTPGADPSGDYAIEFFARAEKRYPGVFAILAGKARRLTGGPGPSPRLNGESLYGSLVAAGSADLFITYQTNAREAIEQRPELCAVTPPPELAVEAAYGLVTLTKASRETELLTGLILSPEGQSALAALGFGPPR